MRPIHVILAVFLWTAAAAGQKQGAAGGATSIGQLAEWRQQRAAQLTEPDGWLSLVALEWLRPGDTTVGSAPENGVRLQHGPAHLLVLRTEADGRVLLGQHDPNLRIGGLAAKTGAVVAGRAETSADSNSPVAMHQGGLLLTVIQRGDRHYLRVRDARAESRLRFRGLRWYPPDPRYRVLAQWMPSRSGHTVTIPNVLGQISQEVAPGVAEFRLSGKAYRLEPIQESPDQLFFIFRDLTSHSETYGAGRFLSTPLPSRGLGSPGTVQLDFNCAVNPPCAYTPYATCPLPPAENRLPIALPAGEKRYQ